MSPKAKELYVDIRPKVPSRQVARRMAMLIVKRFKYEDGGFDRTIIREARTPESRGKYLPHIGRKRGGAGPVFA